METTAPECCRCVSACSVYVCVCAESKGRVSGVAGSEDQLTLEVVGWIRKFDVCSRDY